MFRSLSALLGLLLLAGCGEPPPRAVPGPGDLPYRGTTTVAPMPLVDMTLPDTDGRSYDFRAESEGRIALLFFGYTYCPDICPIHMATLAAALRELDPAARALVDVVFVTVDPERDTPERLRGWLATFDSTFVGLRGTSEQIDEALAFFRYPPPERSADGAVYTVGHPALVYAYTPDGLTHVMYGPETPRAVWRHDLEMMAGYPWDRGGVGVHPDAGDGAATPAPAAPVAEAGDVAVFDAVAPEPPAGSAAALYLTLVNRGPTADTLVGVGAAMARSASLHDMVERDGMTRMEPRALLPLAPGDTVRLAPGGTHAMLEGLDDGALRAGTAVAVTLTFARAGSVVVPVRVVRYEDLPVG